MAESWVTKSSLRFSLLLIDEMLSDYSCNPFLMCLINEYFIDFLFEMKHY